MTFKPTTLIIWEKTVLKGLFKLLGKFNTKNYFSHWINSKRKFLFVYLSAQNLLIPGDAVTKKYNVLRKFQLNFFSCLLNKLDFITIISN